MERVSKSIGATKLAPKQLRANRLSRSRSLRCNSSRPQRPTQVPKSRGEGRASWLAPLYRRLARLACRLLQGVERTERDNNSSQVCDGSSVRAFSLRLAPALALTLTLGLPVPWSTVSARARSSQAGSRAEVRWRATRAFPLCGRPPIFSRPTRTRWAKRRRGLNHLGRHLCIVIASHLRPANSQRTQRQTGTTMRVTSRCQPSTCQARRLATQRLTALTLDRRLKLGCNMTNCY